MARIGIDFGSSYTTIGWVNPLNGNPEPVKFNGDGSVKFPSVILAMDSGLVFGFQAINYLEEVYKLPNDEKLTLLSNFLPSIKRVMKANGAEYLGGKMYSHEDLLVSLFSNIFGKVRDHCGSHNVIDSVVISHPIEFENSKIELLKRAINRNNLSVAETIYEPVAAVKGYSINHKIEENEGILVFDFGGGTIDVAFIQKRHGTLEVVAEPRGNSKCGGQDIDYLLYENLRKQILNEKEFLGFDISSGGKLDYSLLNACRRLKEYFSGPNDSYDTNILLVVNGKFKNYKYRLSREGFNNLIYPKVNDAICVAKQVVSDVNERGASIDKVLLIGGSSQLTLVRQLLNELLPDVDIDTCGEKDITVALGNVTYMQEDREDVAPIDKNDNIFDDEHESLFTEPLNVEKSMQCKSCGSYECYKLVNRVGYHCLNCGWEGKNITITINNTY